MDVREKTVDALEYIEKGAEPKAKPGLSEQDRQWLDSMDTKEQNRIYHKVDRRLVPMLALRMIPSMCQLHHETSRLTSENTVYLIAHLDRANIGNAKIE